MRSRRTGAQAQLARVLGISPTRVWDIVSGFRNAGLELAVRLADLTGTNPLLWGGGGQIHQRPAAVEAWHEKTLADRRKNT